MPRYQISEGVAGNVIILTAKTPGAALQKYLSDYANELNEPTEKYANLRGKTWNFDFEIEDVTRKRVLRC